MSSFSKNRESVFLSPIYLHTYVYTNIVYARFHTANGRFGIMLHHTNIIASIFRIFNDERTLNEESLSVLRFFLYINEYFTFYCHFDIYEIFGFIFICELRLGSHNNLKEFRASF